MAEAKKKAPARPAPTRGKKGQKLAVELVATDIPDVYVEYVQPPELEMTEEDEKNPIYKELRETYARFASREDGYAATYVKPSDAPPERSADAAEEEGGAGAKKEEKTEHDDRDDREDTKPGPGGAEDNDDEDDDEEEEEGAMSNKQKKLLARMKVAELKTHCSKPEVVEVWDTTAADPRLLVYLKAYRNTIPVPSHWCQKRKYLQGKRGLEKPPWQLPSFIEATGIQKLRDAYAEKEDTKKLKQKGKDAKTAKLGKIDIDYQVLHDAFFKFQTKPKMTKVGELYYEGKEYEMDLKGKKPGTLTEETREALGMTDDGPPPWLINMQRYGPPPSYPSLKIPGLSAPIPPGAQFGYHPGGWGKASATTTSAPGSRACPRFKPAWRPRRCRWTCASAAGRSAAPSRSCTRSSRAKRRAWARATSWAARTRTSCRAPPPPPPPPRGTSRARCPGRSERRSSPPQGGFRTARRSR
jgi:splicing factor 3B subunit 2